MAAPSKYLSLHELQVRIRKGVSESHPMPYWVAAEISEIKVNHSGHCYLELVEKGGDNQVPRAKVNAVIWRNHYGLISSYFESATGTKMSGGMKVLVKVTVNYHELYGMSFQVTDIEPSFTIGDMEARRRETIEKLKSEGIFDMNREADLPPVLQHLAVISSEQAAGYRDFMNELGGNSYGYRFHVTLYQSFMQGNETEDSVIAALDLIADDPDRYDAVVIIRGGGAQSDLAAFDSYRLCCHLAQFPLPVITGIGHDKDRSVADLVAHTSVKTPTAAAVFVFARSREFEQFLDRTGDFVLRTARGQLKEAEERMLRYGYRLRDQSSGLLYREKLLAERRTARLRSGAMSVLTVKRNELGTAESGIGYLSKNRLRSAADRLNARKAELSARACSAIGRETGRIDLVESSVRNADPFRILNLGYALVVRQGKRVTHAGQLRPGDRIDVRLPGGTLAASVEEIKNEKK